MVNISKIINKNISLMREPLIARDPLVFWPSDSGCYADKIYYGECERKIYWKMKGEPWTNPVNFRIQRIGHLGSVIESNEIMYSNGTTKLHVDHHISFKYEPEPGIYVSGEIDAIYVFDDIYYGIEYKTGSGWYFRNEIFDTEKALGFPRSKDLLQVMIYLDYCQRHPNMLVNTFKLIYIDRGRGDTQEFDIKLSKENKAIINDELVSNFSIYDILNTYKNIKTHLENNSLPNCCYCNFYDVSTLKHLYRARTITKQQYINWSKSGRGGDYQCQYCGYLNKCLNKENIG